MDMESLKTVLKRNLNYLQRINEETAFQYGPHVVKGREVLESQEFFLKLITENQDWKQLNQKIRKHFRVYRAAGRVGNRAVLFFNVAHTGVRRVRPAWDIDDKYAATLAEAVAGGVEVLAYRAAITPKQIELQDRLGFDLNLPG